MREKERERRLEIKKLGRHWERDERKRERERERKDKEVRQILRKR